jgi:DNA-binding response OmpR family regulator
LNALLFSQDPDEAAILSLVLQRAGLAVGKSSKLERAIQIAVEQPAQLAVLAPKEEPVLAAVRHFRAATSIPLVTVAPQLTEEEHVALLEAGADLVVTRPFSARLLIAQLRALLRRAAGVPFYGLPTQTVGPFTLDPATRCVLINGGESRRLTQLEFRLLYTLMVHRDQVIPAETLVEQIWGYTGHGDRDLVRGLIRRLRTKVEADPAMPEYIVTVPGVGYSFHSA